MGMLHHHQQVYVCSVMSGEARRFVGRHVGEALQPRLDGARIESDQAMNTDGQRILPCGAHVDGLMWSQAESSLMASMMQLHRGVSRHPRSPYRRLPAWPPAEL